MITTIRHLTRIDLSAMQIFLISPYIYHDLHDSMEMKQS